jgi:hypothetical protein
LKPPVVDRPLVNHRRLHTPFARSLRPKTNTKNNRNKNDFKAINAPPGSALARATAASGGTQNDVFSRRHTQSKVYWNTSRAGGGGAEGGEGGPGSHAGGGGGNQLRRSSSSAGEVAQLSGSLKRLDPAELIKVRCVCVFCKRV